jgi:bifunctional non-homologous end joining protein LigD
MPSFIKTTGSRGCHVYVPIMRGPTQKEVWAVAKQMATTLARLRPDLITAEYPSTSGRLNGAGGLYQNAWGPPWRPYIRCGLIRLPAFRADHGRVRLGHPASNLRLDNMPARVKKRGDLWVGLLDPNKRAAGKPLYHAAD